MKVTLIAAHSESGVLSADGRIPWHLPDDMAHFRRCCAGKWLLAGHRTWAQMSGWFQPGQTPVVVTREASLAISGGFAVASVGDALALARQHGVAECVVIGGGATYADALPYAGELLLTGVQATLTGDVYFPALHPADWQEVESLHHPADACHAYAFTIRRLVRQLY